MKLGVCVLNWNAGTVLAGCVENLFHAAQSFEAELVVVDNSSTDSSMAHLRARFPEVQVIANTSNLGYAKGNNLGAHYLLARGCDLLLFANPDVIANESGLRALVRTLMIDPNAGCCGGLPVNSKGVSKAACRTRPSLYEKLVLYGVLFRFPFTSRAYRRHFLNPDSLSDGSPVFAVSGALMLFRSEAFRQVLGFDETTFLYEEEFLIGERLTAQGWKTVVATSCKYFHRGGHSSGVAPYRSQMHFVRSEQYVLRTCYRLHPVARHLWRLYRYLEWLPLALRAQLRHWGRDAAAEVNL